MANTYSIDTNPEALRNIASSIIAYTNCQCQTIRDYLSQMTSQEADIQLQSYQLCIESITVMLKRMEELKNEGDQFAAFLKAKADQLEAFYNQK